MDRRKFFKSSVPEEFAMLRKNTVVIENPRDSHELDTKQSRAVIHNRAGEIVCTFKADRLDCGLELSFATTARGDAFFKITNGVSIGEMPSVIVGDRTLALCSDKSGNSTLHVWIDGSVVVAFVDSKRVVTTRFYEMPSRSDEIQVRWTGKADSLASLAVFDIQPVSPDRLTT